METRIFSKPTDEAVEYCAGIIASGGLAAFPTETVYGLGCNAYDGTGAEKVFAAKGRPADNPLIVHVCRKEDVERIAYVDGLAKKLIDAFMPGPFTVILKKRELIPDTVTAGLDTVAVRFPEDKVACALIERAGVPIAAPSANLSGRPSPTTARHVIEDLDGRVDAILCGEDCRVGVESTVVLAVGGKCVLCRPGKVTAREIKEKTGIDVEIPENLNRTVSAEEKPVSPGMKYKHYAPKAELTLVTGEGATAELIRRKNQGYGIICFDEDIELLGGEHTVSLGKARESEEHARRLFAALRAFDDMNVEKIYSRLPEKSGVGLAVYNRILKAAGSKITEL